MSQLAGQSRPALTAGASTSGRPTTRRSVLLPRRIVPGRSPTGGPTAGAPHRTDHRCGPVLPGGFGREACRAASQDRHGLCHWCSSALVCGNEPMARRQLTKPKQLAEATRGRRREGARRSVASPPWRFRRANDTFGVCPTGVAPYSRRRVSKRRFACEPIRYSRPDRDTCTRLVGAPR